MGAADVVPGVSGGTMAFILGIYEALVLNLRGLSRVAFWRALCTGRFFQAFAISDLTFLAAVGAGILAAVVTLARGIEWMLTHQPVLIWSFFFGLVAASIVSVRTRVARWDLRAFLGFAAGAAFAYRLVGLVPAETPDAPWFLFLAGFVAICAMILPGISGSFVLVLLGKYQDLLAAVNARDFATLGFAAAGCVVGLLLFSHVLGWLLKRFHDPTVAALIGFMLGSLRKIWPWKEATAFAVQRNVLPPWTVGGATNPEVLLAAAAALSGFVAVVAVEALGRQKSGTR